MGVPEKHLFYNRIFHYKPTILGIPHVWKTSYAPLWEVSLTKLMQKDRPGGACCCGEPSQLHFNPRLNICMCISAFVIVLLKGMKKA